jgi:hypothetical protein
MQVETWRDTLGTRLDSQLTFLMEVDRLKTVLRAMTRRNVSTTMRQPI